MLWALGLGHSLEWPSFGVGRSEKEFIKRNPSTEDGPAMTPFIQEDVGCWGAPDWAFLTVGGRGGGTVGEELGPSDQSDSVSSLLIQNLPSCDQAAV